MLLSDVCTAALEFLDKRQPIQKYVVDFDPSSKNESKTEQNERRPVRLRSLLTIRKLKQDVQHIATPCLPEICASEPEIALVLAQ